MYYKNDIESIYYSLELKYQVLYNNMDLYLILISMFIGFVTPVR